MLAFLCGGKQPRAQEFYSEDTPQTQSTLEIDELDALLPEHLRTPLPVKAQAQSTAVFTPIKTDAPETSSTEIEKFYRTASGDSNLAQYGYDFLGNTENNDAASAGAVADDYVLGAGDRINVSFLGERKDRETYVIDRTGALVIDLLPPLVASGKTLGLLRDDLRAMLDAQSFHGDVHLSLERVRQVGVLVAGYVTAPGRHAMTPLQTVLEALEQSGGITKQGSLRQIRLVRKGQSTVIDLYAVMDGTQQAPLPQLADGDRIIVPPLGPTIAVIGDVRQPGIYELPASGKLDSLNALALAGGPLSRGENRITVQSPQNNGTRTAHMIAATSKMVLQDGAIIAVNRTIDRPAALFTLAGETRKAGTYPLSQYKKLSALLRTPQAFGDDVYPLLGIISRRRDSDLVRDLMPFSPQDIFAGRADVTLHEGDQVHLLARGDVLDAMQGKQTEIPKLMTSFIREHGVSVQGAVRLPGIWPVAGATPVMRLIDVAGSTINDADISRAEINRNDVGLVPVSTGAVSRRDIVNLSGAGADNITITFGDAVRIPDRFEAVTRQSVTILGEVRNPGTYDLMRGDTMLILIDRAGGLTDQAYPLGAVFSRAAERKREREKYNMAAHDLERSIALAAQNDDGKVDTTQMALAKDLVNEMKTIEPVGRVTVEADPAILRRDPALDVLLEAGDKVYMPKRPLSVRVTGEVMSPATLQFRADKKPRDYVAEAGGTTLHADNGRMFILYPNGAAQPLRGTSFGRMKPVMIIPGSTIVIPRDPKPFDFIESAKDITQILSNIAITGIYAEDLINKN